MRSKIINSISAVIILLTVMFASSVVTKANTFSLVTLNYNGQSNTFTIYDVELMQIQAGVTTDSLNNIGVYCDSLSYLYGGSVQFDKQSVTDTVRSLLISGNNSIILDLANYTINSAVVKSEEGAAATPVAVSATDGMTPYGLVKISECSTNFNVNQDRAVNVMNAATKINGITLAPGGVFSANNAFTPRTVLNGYGSGDVITAGGHVKAIGGGICQVSSTLNVAVLRAGIIPIERHNHSERIAYLKPGLDATISSGVYDYRFVNTLAYPITIVTSSTGGVLDIALYSDPRALMGMTYETMVQGDNKNNTTHVIGKQNGVVVNDRIAYSSRYK